MKSNASVKILAIAVVVMMSAASLAGICTTDGYSDGAESDQKNDLPSYFNLDISKGYAERFPIRNQGNIGTCWAHATSATVETALYLSDETFSGRISPLAMATTIYDHLYHVNEIPEKIDGEDSFFVIEKDLTKIDCGGNSTEIILTMASGKLAVTQEESMSYTLGSLDLQYNDTEFSDLSSVYTVKDIEIYDMLRDPDTIKSILTQGYVGSVDYKSINGVYGKGLMESRDYTPYFENLLNDTNHAVTLVGWDDNYSKENFKEGITPENDGAWILRNSWGTEETFNGYTYVSYETIIGKVFFIKQIEKTMTDSGLTTTYCYDFGISNEKDIVLNTGASMANVFTSSQIKNDEYLEGISFVTFSKSCWATGEEYTVTVYALDEDFECPTDGKILAVKSGKVTAAGLEYAEFDEPIELSKGMKFSVVVELFNPDGSIIIPVDTDQINNEFVSYTTANPGESWTCINGEWEDISADRTSNVRIKAYTTTKVDGSGSVLSFNKDGNEYVRYDTISKALESGEKDICLLSDLVLTEQIEVEGTESVSISLNGNTVTYSGKGAAFVSEIVSDDETSSKLKVTNGTVKVSETAFEGKGLSLTFVSISADENKDAVKADDSLNLIYSYVKEGNVTVRPTAESEDSKIIANIAGTLDIGPCYDSTVSIEGGCYGRTVFDSSAAAKVMYGSFSNNIEYNDASNVNIIVGTELGKDPSVIAEMMNNRHGDGIVLDGNAEKGYNFVLAEIAAQGYTAYYSTISDALTEDVDGEYVVPAYGDVYHRHVFTCKNSGLTIGGNKSIDLNGQTVVVNKTIIIPDGLSLTVFNGILIGETVFAIKDGGSLTLGKEGCTTKIIGTDPLKISVGASVETVGDAAVEWKYTDQLNNTYMLTTSSITTDVAKSNVKMVGTGKVVDSGNNKIADCTEFTRTVGNHESAAYSGYSEFGTFRFSGYVFEELTTGYIQPNDTPISFEDVNGKVHTSFEFDCVTEKYEYKIGVKNFTNGTENRIDILITGLKPFVNVEPTHLEDAVDAVNSVKQYLDMSLPTTVCLDYCVSYEYYKDFETPYKTFTKDIIDLAVKNGYSLSLKFDDIEVSVDPKDLSANDFSILVKRNSNEFMNDHQLAAAGNIKGYSIGYSGEGQTDVGFTVSLKVNSGYESPAFYMVNDDGTVKEMDTVFENGIATFTAEETGVYIITEKDSFVTAKRDPAAKTGLTYNGSEKKLIVPASGVSFGVAEYSLDGEDWSTDIPTAKDAGTYHVYYRYVSTDDTHIGTSSYGFDVEIQPGYDDTAKVTIGAVMLIVVLCECLVAAILIRRK